jgi:hypothetical protein
MGEVKGDSKERFRRQGIVEGVRPGKQGGERGEGRKRNGKSV